MKSDPMLKKLRAAGNRLQRQMSRQVKDRLEATLRRIRSLIALVEDLEETNDGENLLGKLTNAKLDLEEAQIYYCEFLGKPRPPEE